MNLEEAKNFCSHWLPAWTGNQPETLLSFYADNAFYRDPGRPDGLRGHGQLKPYFQKLLALNPEWIWKALEIFPNDKGFLIKWEATIPIRGQAVVETGLDIVEIVDGKIIRNEVYFDPTQLLNPRKR